MASSTGSCSKRPPNPPPNTTPDYNYPDYNYPDENPGGNTGGGLCALDCDFKSNSFCSYNARDSGAVGAGKDGWRVVTGSTNKVNPLTGIRKGPNGGTS